MRFLIRKTSEWFPDEPPVAGAEKFDIEYYDVRTCKTPEEFDAKGIEKVPWLEYGSEHGTVTVRGETCIRRRRPRDRQTFEHWAVDISNLVDFAEVHGNIILSPPETWRIVGESLPSVEIYDDYRE